MSSSQLNAQLQKAQDLIDNDKNYDAAEKIYLELLNDNIDESIIYKLSNIYILQKDVPNFKNLVLRILNLKLDSKNVKIFKKLIDFFNFLPNSYDDQIEIIKKAIELSISNKKIFLKNFLSIKLANLFYLTSNFTESLSIINSLLKEFKKLDDKPSLVDVNLLSAKVYHKLRNLPKSKASLTSARTAANSIYCSSLTMADLDLMSGVLHCEDKDYKTAFSYFYESFESYHNLYENSTKKKTSNTTENNLSVNQFQIYYEKACKVLKYMLLSKIMLNLFDDVNNILTAKYTKDFYQSTDIDAMKAIASAFNKRSLTDFNNSMKQYNDQLMSDDLIKSHFNALYDNLLESNLTKIIEPFDCVEISHISRIIGLDSKQVEGKLSQMILDKIFYGVLDQGNGWLYIYDTPHHDDTYDSALELVGQLNKVVDQLYEKASVLY